MNPVIKFTTLFGLLAVELAVYLAAQQGAMLIDVLAVVFFVISMFFVYRSFYGMRIESNVAVRGRDPVSAVLRGPSRDHSHGSPSPTSKLISGTAAD